MDIMEGIGKWEIRKSVTEQRDTYGTYNANLKRYWRLIYTFTARPKLWQ